MIQETHSEETPRLPGYPSHNSPPSERVTSKGKGRRVCTFVRKEITFMEHELIGRSTIEHCTVEVITGRKGKESTFLVNVYSNPSHGHRSSRHYSTRRERNPDHNKERRLARGRALVDLHAREGAVYVDAAEYQGSSDAVVSRGIDGCNRRPRRASGLEESTGRKRWPSPLACCDSRKAAKNYAKGRICSEAARTMRKAEDIGRNSAVVIKWFPAHMGSDVSERGNANHIEMDNAAARGLTNRAAANTANSECWSRYSAKDKMTSFNKIVRAPAHSRRLTHRRNCHIFPRISDITWETPCLALGHLLLEPGSGF
ncbi:hypothetical protein HPB47_018298 [Ixodes persulcatus]|uniref:Uncharacterized protein n=1 Tax=Ixodes persulcatus TaxID=34615 RepID=A0AC60QL46_IXOPE|nr:hypothetical protein HPB47_018298 [Ixodes persulcatus]